MGKPADKVNRYVLTLEQHTGDNIPPGRLVVTAIRKENLLDRLQTRRPKKENTDEHTLLGDISVSIGTEIYNTIMMCNNGPPGTLTLQTDNTLPPIVL